MLELRRIISSDDVNLDVIKALYVEAFPAYERKDMKYLNELINNEDRMYFYEIKYKKELAGFFVYWNLGEFYFLEYLAIRADMRNQQIGQQLLELFKRDLEGVRILEAEPPADEISDRRVKYYIRNGYEVIDRDYVQPSYWKGEQGVPMWLMSNKNDIDAKTLKKYITRIMKVVYRQ